MVLLITQLPWARPAGPGTPCPIQDALDQMHLDGARAHGVMLILAPAQQQMRSSLHTSQTLRPCTGSLSTIHMELVVLRKTLSPVQQMMIQSGHVHATRTRPAVVLAALGQAAGALVRSCRVPAVEQVKILPLEAKHKQPFLGVL